MELNSSKKNILITPLNWGLGHATRCIPIIIALLQNNYTPIIASDGHALVLLKKEFPTLLALELPSYQIEYSKKGRNLKWNLLRNVFKTIKAIKKEKKIIDTWIKQYNISALISDNRLGVYSNEIPSVYITHQLNVLSGNSTWFTSKIHQKIIRKHTECWIPDFEENPNLTGKLGHLSRTDLKLNYIGPLSRLQKRNVEIKYDLMIVLSGPEPQRGLLEEKLKKDVQNYSGQIVFVKGIVQKDQITEQVENVTYYNFMNSSQLEQAFNESEIILSRSGYTTIMDVAKLEKKVFFIPTPGQYEQEYLAKKLNEDYNIPFSTQKDFNIENIQKAARITGYLKNNYNLDWPKLFEVFEK